MSEEHVAGPQIRLATLDDYDRVCELYQQLDTFHVALLPETFRPIDGLPRPLELFREMVSSPDKALFVAVRDSYMVGFIDVQKISNPPFPMFKPRDLALVDNFLVIDQFRGSGLAHLLFERVKIWAVERGLSTLRLKVHNANVGAVRFYQKEGMFPTVSTYEINL
jgi:diamine N-acetyltransferase